MFNTHVAGSLSTRVCSSPAPSLCGHLHATWAAQLEEAVGLQDSSQDQSKCVAPCLLILGCVQHIVAVTTAQLLESCGE